MIKVVFCRLFRDCHCRSIARRGAYLLTVLVVAFTGCGGRPTVERVADGRAEDVPAWFTDVTDAVGLAFEHDLEPAGSYFMPEIMGSGAAFVDYDGDGRLDIFLVNGFWGEGGAQAVMRNRLYRQTSDGRLVDVTAAAGLQETPGYGVGVAFGDVDNDGAPDLYVACYGPDRFWRNNGDGTFTEASSLLETANERWGTAAAFCDYDRDGALDLFVVNYVDYYPTAQCDDGGARQDYCGPQSFSGTTARLYRNLGGVDERGILLADVTVEAGLTAAPGPGLGLICRDFNDDGRPDFYVANDMKMNPLWIQQEDGSFVDEGAVRGVAGNRLGQTEASMGVVANDLDDDGNVDLFITNLRGETNTFFRGMGGGEFLDATASSGLGPPSLPYTGFGTVAFDLECDGDLDLVVGNGRVKRGPPLPGAELGEFWDDYAEPGLLFLNEGRGKFRDRTPLSGPLARQITVTRGMAAGDFDNDGDLDLVVTRVGSPARLYRNDAPRQGHWLMVRVLDPVGAREGVGARITVDVGGRTFRREVAPSLSYLSHHDLRAHFGLAEAGAFDRITVQWPDGVCEAFPGGVADRELVCRRGGGARVSTVGAIP